MKYFGTDGIRGQVNEQPLTPDFVQRFGRTVAETWDAGPDRPILVGHDGRLSSDLLINAFQSGVLGAGGDVVNVGLCSTPSLSFLGSHRRNGGQGVAGGMMISASHNPFSDNGLKPFHPTGRKLTREEEESIERSLETGSAWAESKAIGREHRPEDPLKPYVEALRERATRSELSVLVDAANGGTSDLLKRVLDGMVGELHVINDRPDGRNINQDCGSLYIETLEDEVNQKGCDVGFALDGDGDRVLGITPEGSLIDGDRMLYLLARYGRDSRFRTGVTMTVMSNLALRLELENHDVPYEVTPVGDREVYHALKERDWALGGEQSGHIIDREWLPTGDGINTMLLLLELLGGDPSALEEWVRELSPYPQVLHNQRVPAKPVLTSLSEARELIDEMEQRMGDKGRVLVRYSGTEPLLRVMLEGDGSFPLEEWARELSDQLLRRIEEKVNAP